MRGTNSSDYYAPNVLRDEPVRKRKRQPESYAMRARRMMELSEEVARLGRLLGKGPRADSVLQSSLSSKALGKMLP